MRSRDFRIIFLGAILVALIYLGFKFVVKDEDGIVYTSDKRVEDTSSPEQFTLDIANIIAADAWGTCVERCDAMQVDYFVYEGEDRIVATYEGLQDDSVQAERYEASVSYDTATREWKIGDSERLWKCQPGRGSQEWTDALCL